MALFNIKWLACCDKVFCYLWKRRKMFYINMTFKVFHNNPRMRKIFWLNAKHVIVIWISNSPKTKKEECFYKHKANKTKGRESINNMVVIIKWNALTKKVNQFLLERTLKDNWHKYHWNLFSQCQIAEWLFLECLIISLNFLML